MPRPAAGSPKAREERSTARSRAHLPPHPHGPVGRGCLRSQTQPRHPDRPPLVQLSAFLFTMCFPSVIKNPTPKFIVFNGKGSGLLLSQLLPIAESRAWGIRVLFSICLQKFSVCTTCSFFRPPAVNHLDLLALLPYARSPPRPSPASQPLPHRENLLGKAL